MKLYADIKNVINKFVKNKKELEEICLIIKSSYFDAINIDNIAESEDDIIMITHFNGGIMVAFIDDDVYEAEFGSDSLAAVYQDADKWRRTVAICQYKEKQNGGK